MTASNEATELRAIRKELGEYHLEVREHIARCEHCRIEMDVLAADVYGVPGNDASTGLMGHVAELRGSRRRMLIGLRSAWALLLVVGGAVLGKFFQ